MVYKIANDVYNSDINIGGYMKDQIKVKTNEILDETIEKIQELVRIPSVRDVEHKQEGAPFGPAISEALDTFLKMAEEIGMRTYRCPEGYYGYCEIGPEDAEMVGILGHLDVVPAGDLAKWTEAGAFSGDIVDGKIIGRGTLDDKGPMLLNLMGIKALVESGHKFNRRVRFILGTAEETTWEGINAYNAKEEAPELGYSPDANFPIINAEKTIVQFDASSKVDADFTVESLGAYNAVADSAVYTGSKAAEISSKLDELGYAHKLLADNKVDVAGVAAHAMQCFVGQNAITRLAEAMYAVGETTPAIEFLATCVKETKHAELICGNVEDEISGKLTLNIGNIRISEGTEVIGLDSRIPVLANEKEVIAQYEQAIKDAGLEYNLVKVQEKLYVDEQDELIQTLMSVYKEVTGDQEAKLLSSGGGTYARSMKKGVAFGMVFTKEGMIDNMHQANECLEIKFIQPALEIYTNALYELSK